MLIKHKKMILGICLLLGVLFYLLGCINTEMATPQALKYPREARRSVSITIDTSQRLQLFDQLRKFSNKHGFSILIDTRSSGPDDYFISITGGDIEIDGANAFVLEEYELGFYDIDLLHAAPDSDFDDLISDLQSFIDEVPGATFTVEK